jgi:hypothetical protein
MKHMRARYIIIGGLALLLASCGQQYKAEKTVKAFVEENMEVADKISGCDFADVGTTRHISDSLIQVMRHRGAPLFKQGISYGNVPQGELFFLRMRFIHKGDTLQNTFYLNQELTEVVAFK